MNRHHAAAQLRWSILPRNVLVLALAITQSFLRAADAGQCIMTAQPTDISVTATYGTSKTGPLPAAGNCISWTLNVEQGLDAPCMDPTGQMQLELWVLNSQNSAVDPRVTLPGIYLAVTRAPQAPIVDVSSAGTRFIPSLVFGPDPTYVSTYIDTDSVRAESGAQRMLLPVGDLYTSAAGLNVDYFTWKLSLSNMNPDLPAGLR